MFSRQQYDAVVHRAGLLRRGDRGRLRFTGADRRAYLQGLLTNDITALTAGEGCYAAFLTPQGRMIADMRLWETGEEVLVDLHADLASGLRDRFDQFIFTEDAQVEDVTSGISQLAILGPAAAAVLDGARDGGHDTQGDSLAALPERAFANRTGLFRGSPLVVCRSDEVVAGGLDLFIDAARADELDAAILQAGAEAISLGTYDVLRVESGRPAFRVDMDEDTIPLEAGIEDRAISLTKGCYVGQEIIIRVLHRGHGRVARRLVGLTLLPAARVPARGSRIRAADRDVGVLTSAVRSPALERPIALGYVHRAFVEPGTELSVLDGDHEATATVTRLPFVG
ncbi:MAG TPA: glycine cleavage T C-terminal barrel domain-containing protein [Vicinamibacterales bacterium]|nr:glycine cleavage T C-terminal barrel domain-containing protein [Vicinamibacterales bacterium]